MSKGCKLWILKEIGVNQEKIHERKLLRGFFLGCKGKGSSKPGEIPPNLERQLFRLI